MHNCMQQLPRASEAAPMHEAGPEFKPRLIRAKLKVLGSASSDVWAYQGVCYVMMGMFCTLSWTSGSVLTARRGKLCVMDGRRMLKRQQPGSAYLASKLVPQQVAGKPAQLLHQLPLPLQLLPQLPRQAAM